MASVIVNGARTPMGRLLGNLKDLPATKLGGVAIKAALERSGVAPEQVQYVIMGQVLQAGAGQMPARQAAVGAGIPMTRAGADGQQGLPVRAGRDRAGRPAHPGRRVRHRRGRRHGVDDQRPAPADRPARTGYKYGDVTMVDHMALDGLTDAYEQLLDGRVDRPAQRRARHHPRRAGRVRRAQPPAGRRRAEERRASPRRSSRSTLPQRKGDPIVITEDEGDPPGHHRRDAGQAAPGVRRRTARSPPAPRRRSPTAPARSS